MTAPATEALAAVSDIPRAAATSVLPAAELGWARIYATRLAITDVAVIAWAVIGAQILWFGSFDSALNLSKYRGGFALSYTLISIAVIVIWALALALFGTRDSRVVGSGPAEYRRVVDGTLRLFGVLAILAFLLKIDLARGFLITALPVGLLALLASRWMWRQWLSAERDNGRFVARAVVVGSPASVAAITRDLARQPLAGYLVVAACIPGSTVEEVLPGSPVPVSHDLDAIQELMASTTADTVIVTGSDELPPERIRELSWSLAPSHQHLVLAPSLTDIGGPRIHTRPVAGLPLIHVETPRYEGAKLFYKRAFDFVGAAGLIVLLLPLLVVIAAAVRLSSPGPLLFRQERVGLNGRRFPMLKFRTMVVDAEERLAELQARHRTEGNAVMFKMKDDPRMTPIGRILRRHSLDELPQLVNVLSGSMSLVGPRPPLDREVAIYENHVHRRFLVKPGVTGLWQVSGRATLSWEDTVRLDLYYVENWSITSDIVILWRTIKAVMAREGAF